MGIECELLNLSLKILNDECPPDRSMYLCSRMEFCEGICKECWSNYLRYVVNGRKHHPYRRGDYYGE